MKKQKPIILLIVLGIITYITLITVIKTEEKPISYPEEIQIAKKGDTLYVTSVSDSIYLGFKK